MTRRGVESPLIGTERTQFMIINAPIFGGNRAIRALDANGCFPTKANICSVGRVSLDMTLSCHLASVDSPAVTT